MNSFQKMLKKLYHYWLGNKKPAHYKDNALSDIHTISVVLYPNLMVDILTTHPCIKDMSQDALLSESEKFAELLLYVSNHLLDTKIISTIENKSKVSNNISEKLFYDNVIKFYDILKKEYSILYNENNPVIRPSLVFNK